MSTSVPFTLRVRDNTGMKRILFASGPQATFADLQREIHALCGVPPSEQQISSSPPPQVSPLSASPSASLSSLNLKHGDLLYLCNTATVSPATHSMQKTALSSAPPVALTPQCSHPPSGRCTYCAGLKPGETPKFSGKCTHGPSAVCINCALAPSTSPAAASAAQPAPWLCTHPSSAFCPKCLPPAPAAKPVVAVVPFARHLSDLSALCKFRHAPTTRCAMCVPPPQPSFKGSKTCDRGHLPYPRGSCPKCAPANAVLRPQAWRYVDGVSLPSAGVENCYRAWTKDNQRGVQRAWLLYGKVIDDTDDVENVGARRAVVAAFYEPAQEKRADRVTLLPSADQDRFERVMGWLGLRPVGWLFLTGPRADSPKYGGKVVLTGAEVVTAARLQHEHRQVLQGAHMGVESKQGDADEPFTYSEFVTVCVEHADTVEPRAYMISDQGVALVRDGAVRVGADVNMLQTATPTSTEPAATVVYHDHPLGAGQEFLPDNLIVKVRTMAAKPAHTLFAHYSFLAPRDADKVAVRVFLQTHKSEPWLQRVSDANLLATLSGMLEESLMQQVCRSIARKHMDADVATELAMALYQQQLCDFD